MAEGKTNKETVRQTDVERIRDAERSRDKPKKMKKGHPAI